MTAYVFDSDLNETAATGASSAVRAKTGARARWRKPFTLTRWFAVLSLVSIALVGTVTTLLLSRFLVVEMLHRDAQVTQQFVQGVVEVEHAEPYFRGNGQALGDKLADFLEHIARMPDTLRTNVYSTDRTLIWSSDPQLMGKKFDFNPELDEALAGETAVEADILEQRRFSKPEHVFLIGASKDFVENYLPIWDAGRHQVVGVIEVYKEPKALFAAIYKGLRLIWACAILGGLFLFAALYWIVHRASRVMREQERQLVSQETFAAVGETASAVAHGIRNPLSAIRTSAELLVDANSGAHNEQTHDIIAEVDRLEAWVRNLLTYAHRGGGGTQNLVLSEVIETAVTGFERELERVKITPRVELQQGLPRIIAESALLTQVFQSLLANAIEAMPNGGELAILAHAPRRANKITVQISDTGVGMSAEQLERIFQPFHTTKKRGLGVGLPLVKRAIERLGGSINFRSELGAGTTVTLDIPVR
jgi:two-component system, NtrC family, sensor histidine kinase HydH